MDRRLESFLVLCEKLNYRKTADAMHLTQPAVTRQIQSLEAEYGVKLFRYDGRKLYKTEKGDALERYAISLRYNEEELVRDLRSDPHTLLRIGATKSIGDYVLIPEIRRFLERKGNELFVTVDNTEHLLRQLDQKELDFLVVEGIFDKQRYEHFLLRNEPFIGICAPDHPFSGQKVPLSKLFLERLILREPGSGTRNIFERELAELGYTTGAFRELATISSFKIIRELVAAGLGISFLYEAVVKDDAAFGHFFCEPLTGIHELNVVYLKNTAAGSYARRFLE